MATKTKLTKEEAIKKAIAIFRTWDKKDLINDIVYNMRMIELEEFIEDNEES